MANKFDGAYLEIVDVSANPERILVSFANGDRVQLPTASVAPSRRRTGIDWDGVRLNSARTTILVPADATHLEIPATRVRRLTDKRFADHLSKVAHEQAKMIGSRLKLLRERHGLTQKHVAQAAGLEPANLSRIESGRFDVSSTTLWRVLSAMDCSIADLLDTESKQGQAERRETSMRA